MNPSLRKNSNYPPMSDWEWKNSPWMQVDPPEETFDIAVSCSLSKDTEVISTDYEDDEFSDRLNEPWNAYTDSEDTVDQIIDFARKCAEYMLNKHDYSIESKYGLRRMIDSCKGWVVDENNVEQI